MSYKVGDLVTIRPDLSTSNSYYTSLVDPMLKYKGKIARITDIDSDGDCILCIDGGAWYWSTDMFVSRRE